MIGETEQQRRARERLERIARSRQALADRYAADPEGVERFNSRMRRMELAREREEQRVARLIRGGDPEPSAPVLTRPQGMSRQDWKILRARLIREHRAALDAWSKKQNAAEGNAPPAEQQHRAPFVEQEVTDYKRGRLHRIGRAYCRQPRFELIEGLSVAQLAALRRYRKLFDASELSPVKSALDVGPGGGGGGSDAAISRVEAIAFADVAVKRVEAAVPRHQLPILRAIALYDLDFKAVAIERFGSASGQRRSRVKAEFFAAVDSLVIAMTPPAPIRPADAETASTPEQHDVEVNPAFLDDRGLLRPMAEIAEIILANLDLPGEAA